MECPKCHSIYQKEKNIPLLLIKCGHTLCDSCATTIFNGKSILCPECGNESQVASVATLPKNMALLAMSPAPPPSSLPHVDLLCSVHQKKLEAFCLDDRVLLCIDCILLDGHKSHDISPIAQASEKERISLQKGLENANKLSENLTLLLSDIENFRIELNEKANGKREKVTSVFKEITNVIHERESQLKQNISNILEKEEEVLQSTTKQIKDHLQSIEQFKLDAVQVQSETDCVLLEKSKDRQKMAAEANRPSPMVSFAVTFPDVRKENELNVLWKILCPQASKQSNLYATTASYANKRTEKVKAPSNKAHQEREKVGLKQLNKDKKKQGVEAGAGIERILSPRRDMGAQGTNQPADFSKLSQFLNCSGFSSSSNSIMLSAKSSAAPKEESKIFKPTASNAIEFAKNDLEGAEPVVPLKQVEISVKGKSETTPTNSETPIPTALISMQNDMENIRETIVQQEGPVKQTPKNIQERMIKPLEIAVASTPVAKETAAVPMTKTSLSSNDLFVTLREKREKYKKDKIDAQSECKAENEAVKEPAASSPAPANPKVSVDKLPSAAVGDSYSSIFNSCQKTPSVTPSLYEMYINGGDCERMDLKSMLEVTSQYIYAFSGYSETGLCACEKYDAQQAIWKEIKAIGKPRSKFAAACTTDGQALVMGGKFVDGARTDLIERYVPSTNEWVTCPFKLTRAKSSFACVSTPTGIYLCGGSDGHILRTCEHLDLLSCTWKPLANLKYKREEHGFTMGPDGKLYAVGGFNGKSCLGSAERYDMQKNSWEEIGPLQTPRRSLCAVALPDGVYALGGYDGQKYLDSVEKYDPAKNQWVPVRPMNHPRCTMACLSSPDYRFIYAIGGYDGSPLNLVERYDVMHDTWEFVTPMKSKRFMHAAVITSVSVSQHNLL